MDKNKKVYVFIIGINLIIVVILLYYVSIYKRRNSSYLILPGDEIHYLENNTLHEVDYEIKKPLDVIFKSDKEKDMTFTYKDKLIIFYEKGEPIVVPDNFKIAFSKNSNLKLLDYELKEVEKQNLKKLDEILSKHGIIGYDYLTTSKKMLYDFDNDGEQEEIYFVSNLFEELKYNKVFSFVYYIKDDEIVYLNEEVTSRDNAYDLCSPEPNSIIDLGGRKSLIITCSYFSGIGTKNYIYHYGNGTFTKIN